MSCKEHFGQFCRVTMFRVIETKGFAGHDLFDDIMSIGERNGPDSNYTIVNLLEGHYRKNNWK